MDKQSVMEAFNRKFGTVPSYEDVKPYLYPRLVKKGLDDGFSDEVVEISMLDFMVRFYVLVDEEDDSIASFPITMTLMDGWDLTMGQLLHDAVTSAQKMLPAEIMSIEDTLGLYGEDVESVETFYVLSNRRRHYGASAMLYDKVLSDFEEKIGGKFSIIPSSIHEVLLIPDSLGIPPKDLKEMLLDVNSSIVDPAEVLGQHIYLYDRESGLRFADDAHEEA